MGVGRGTHEQNNTSKRSIAALSENKSFGKSDLSALEKKLKKTFQAPFMTDEKNALQEHQRLRLLSLVQELLDKPDDAYISLNKINLDPKPDWHPLRELYLADVLGLKDDFDNLSTVVEKRWITPSLRIPKVAFCRAVQAFGDYEPLDANKLVSGEMIILYIEILGLQQNNDQEKIKLSPDRYRYQSRYKASFSILDLNGNTVFQHYAPEPFHHTSKSQRRDTYLWMKWRPKLTPGDYRLRMLIEDELAMKTATAEKAFRLQ